MIAPIKLSQLLEFMRRDASTKDATKNAQAFLINGDAIFDRVNTDTRSLQMDELFIALKGDTFDGHDFAEQAAQKGVCALVVTHEIKTVDLPQLIVSDTYLALGQVAHLNRQAFKKPVLAVTGSNGKTTVKTMLASILSECGKVLATQGNLNNHVGVPITLLQLNPNHDFAVIEMGASAKGEIAYSCSLAEPDVSMVNNVMPAHIEGFGSLRGVAEAKGEIYSALSAEKIAVINLDDQFASEWKKNLVAKSISVSLNNSAADCYAKNIQLNIDDCEFDLILHNLAISIRLAALGEHSVRNALMAAAMASSVSASLQAIKSGLEKFIAVSGRMHSVRGVHQALIIDDTYNANPGSVRAAMDVLATRDGEKIFVLGDLGELGDQAEALHADLGLYAKQKKIDRLLTLGKLSRQAALNFGDPQKIHFTDRANLIEELKKLAKPNATILVKGSRSAKMELVVQALCTDHSGNIGDSH